MQHSVKFVVVVFFWRIIWFLHSIVSPCNRFESIRCISIQEKVTERWSNKKKNKGVINILDRAKKNQIFSITLFDKLMNFNDFFFEILKFSPWIATVERNETSGNALVLSCSLKTRRRWRNLSPMKQSFEFPLRLILSYYLMKVTLCVKDHMVMLGSVQNWFLYVSSDWRLFFTLHTFNKLFTYL